MSTLTFFDTHNMVAFLEKPAESDGFHEIIDFLNANQIYYALIVNPAIYTSCIEQFWATTKAKTVNGERQLQVLVDKKKLGDMSHHKKIYVNPSHTKKIFANMKREGKDFSGRVTPLFATMMVQANQEEGVDSGIPTASQQTPITIQPSTSKPQKKQSRRKQKKTTAVPYPSDSTDDVPNEDSMPTHSNDPLLSGEDRLKLTDLMDMCTKLSKRVLDLEHTKTAQAQEITNLKLRVKKLENKVRLRTHKFKRLYKGRSIEDIDKDAEVSLVDETHGRSDDAEMFDTDALIGNEVCAENDMIEKDQDVIPKKVSTTAPSTTVVSPPVITKSTATTTPSIIPKAKGITFRDAGESITRTPTSISSLSIKDKGKAKMDEPEVPLKKKDQNEEMAEILKLKYKLNSLKKKGLKKHFAKLRVEEKRRKPPTKAQKRNLMSTYLKNIGGYKYNQLKRKSYDEIQKLFDNKIRKVNTFIPMDSEVVKSKEGTEESSKRIENELEPDKSKKAESSEKKAEGSRKKSINEHEEAEKDDEAEKKKHMEVVQDDEEIAIDVIPLATKPPIIVEYKINVSREDLETLWKLVKTKHGNTRPKDDYEKVFWDDLKVMFEPDIKSKIWKSLQGYKVTVWKLFDSSRVHFVRFKNLHIFMLVEKRYLLTPITITNMLNKKFQADYWNEMYYQLLKHMVKQQKG
ncbi:hypothetical protein Tco_0241764 [Tanacetum coccineum]